ncbi:MAG: hypothetical protein GY944_17460 [bacterium]|nr:hypothetical protein [bacterium]
MACVRVGFVSSLCVTVLCSLVFTHVAAARPRGDRCVASPDGVVLHHPSGAACGDAERETRVKAQRRQRGETNAFQRSAQIPPANPFVPGDLAARQGRGPWQPAEPGTRMLYRHSKKRTLYAGPHLAGKFVYRGDRSEEFLAAPSGMGGATVEIRTTDRLIGDSGVGDVHETQRHYVIPGATHYRSIASEMAVRGKRVVVRQPEASELLVKGAEPGEPWPAGVEVIDGLAFEREGELMGVQGVDTPLGRFERCLVVRYTGKLMKPGLSPLGDGTRVKAGTLVTTEWIARGVGRVQSKQEGELELGPVRDMPGRLTFEARSQLHQVQRLADRRDQNPAAALDKSAKARAVAGLGEGSWRLSLDSDLPLGTKLPMDVIRLLPDAKVSLAKGTRVYASCSYAVAADMLTIRCRHPETFQKMAFDLIVSPGARVLTTAVGSQYTREE